MFSLIALALVVLIALILAAAKGKLNKNSEIWPFYAKKPLTNPEQVLYFRLTKALPEHIVLAQAQLSRFLGVKKGNNYQSWLNRVNRMSADFVICNMDSSVLAVIELDDSSHNAASRQVADAKKDKALSAAEIKIHRWNVKAIPDDATIKIALLGNAPPSVAKV